MAMKVAQSQETTQKPMPGSTKQQIVSRLRRAISYADNLVSVLQDRSTSKASVSDTLEARAYLFMLKGTLDFEKARWESWG
jgi:signal recognition particle subunit SRP68